jgi:hypothetical protein
LPHPLLRDLNYIHFYADASLPRSGFGTGQARLVQALAYDIKLLREHTRLEELAVRWERDGCPTGPLLRESELLKYCRLRDLIPSAAPELTALQRRFLAASETAEAEQAGKSRKLLDDMAKAQDERQVALEERQAALQREADAQRDLAKTQRSVTRRSLAVAAIGIPLALITALNQAKLKLESEKQREKVVEQKADTEELIRRIRVGVKSEFGISAMRRICDDATNVTARLARSTNQTEFAALKRRFLELYFGPMNLVEIRQKTEGYDNKNLDVLASPIESAMVDYESALDDLDGGTLPRMRLIESADKLRTSCNDYLPGRSQ